MLVQASNSLRQSNQFHGNKCCANVTADQRILSLGNRTVDTPTTQVLSAESDPSTPLARALDVTIRTATSWVGFLTAYAGAVVAAILASQKLSQNLSRWPVRTRVASSLRRHLPYSFFTLFLRLLTREGRNDSARLAALCKPGTSACRRAKIKHPVADGRKA